MDEDIEGSGCERKVETDEGLEERWNRKEVVKQKKKDIEQWKKNWPQIDSMRSQTETD